MARRAVPAAALAIEISSRAAKLMEADLAPLRIARVRAVTVAEPSPDGLGALKALLDVAPVTGREVGLAIGREAFTLRTLELPSRDPKEIASMLELQLGKLTPYPRAEIFFAWSLIGAFREGYTTVLLAVGRKALIDGALALLAAKGARALWIGISTEGLAAWSVADAKTAPSARPSPEPPAPAAMPGGPGGRADAASALSPRPPACPADGPPPPRNCTRSARTSIVERFCPSASQLRDTSRPSTNTARPFFKYWLHVSAWRLQTMTLTKHVSSLRSPVCDL